MYSQFLCQKNFEQIIQKGLFESLKDLQSFFLFFFPPPINRVTIQMRKYFWLKGGEVFLCKCFKRIF